MRGEITQRARTARDKSQENTAPPTFLRISPKATLIIFNDTNNNDNNLVLSVRSADSRRLQGTTRAQAHEARCHRRAPGADDEHRALLKSIPKALHPETFALPKSLNPKAFALPKSLNPKTFALPKSKWVKSEQLPGTFQKNATESKAGYLGQSKSFGKFWL